jgi:uncharacterized membrane protein YccF (DUF307 family)
MALMNIPSYSLAIKPSRILLVYFGLVHGLLAITLFYLPLSNVMLTLFLLIVTSHSMYKINKYYLAHSSREVIRCDYIDRVWRLQFSDCQRVVELRFATVWRYLLVMNFFCSETGETYHLVLLPDSGNHHQLRHLRIVLRHLPVFGLTSSA